MAWPRSSEPARCSSEDRKSTRLNSSHLVISYAVFCLKKKRNHPRGAGQRIAGAMMLDPVAAGVVVRVASEVRQNEQRCFAGVLRLALNSFPNVGAEPVGAPDTINVKRVGTGVGDIDIVHGDPEEARRLLAHELTNDVNGEFVGARQGERVSLEVVNRELPHHSQLLQFKFAAAELWGVERCFIVVAEEMFVVRAAAGCRGRQKMLGQNYLCSKSRAVGAVAAFTNAVETVAGSNDPGIGGEPLQVLAEIFKDGWMFGGKGSKVVDRFIDRSEEHTSELQSPCNLV